MSKSFYDRSNKSVFFTSQWQFILTRYKIKINKFIYTFSYLFDNASIFLRKWRQLFNHYAADEILKENNAGWQAINFVLNRKMPRHSENRGDISDFWWFKLVVIRLFLTFFFLHSSLHSCHCCRLPSAVLLSLLISKQASVSPFSPSLKTLNPLWPRGTNLFSLYKIWIWKY